MNYAELLQNWSSPLNHPAPGELERQKKGLTRALIRRRVGFVAIMTPPALFLSVLTGMLAWRFGSQGVEAGWSGLAGEWAAPALLLMAWMLYGLFLRGQCAHLRNHPAGDASILANLRALLDENRRSQLRIKWVMWTHLASLPLLAMSLRQLDQLGKIQPREFASALFFFGLVAGVSMLGLWLYLVRKLRPEGRRLGELVRDYEE